MTEQESEHRHLHGLEAVISAIQESERDYVVMLVHKEGASEGSLERDESFPVVGSNLYCLMLGLERQDGSGYAVPWMMKLPDGDMNPTLFREFYQGLVGMQQFLVKIALKSIPMADVWSMINMPEIRLN